MIKQKKQKTIKLKQPKPLNFSNQQKNGDRGPLAADFVFIVILFSTTSSSSFFILFISIRKCHEETTNNKKRKAATDIRKIKYYFVDVKTFIMRTDHLKR